MRADAYSKINLTLRVEARSPSGFHPIRSLAQSIDWADRVEVDHADEDDWSLDGADLAMDGTNLAVRALEAVREATGRRHPVRLRLVKRIPSAAGLAGASADAAAVLALASHCLRLDPRARNALGPSLGADVVFCLKGGLARMTGFGERVQQIPEHAVFHPAVVVPPPEMPTADVYRRWDELDGPTGPEIPARFLPPALRSYAPVVNDLTPAALDLAPDLGDWISDLSHLWGTPVAMSGSGSALFALFPTRSEADGAAAAVGGARAARGCSQTSMGWRELDDDGTC